jgi:hypothetical protein
MMKDNYEKTRGRFEEIRLDFESTDSGARVYRVTLEMLMLCKNGWIGSNMSLMYVSFMVLGRAD